MKAFEVKLNGKVYDYRVGANLNLDEVKKFFENKGFVVNKIWQEKRHVVGILEKSNIKSFLKLAPTEGISATTHIDYNWNKELNKYLNQDSTFAVPKNIEDGYYKANLYYILEDYFPGELLAKRPTPDARNDGYKNIIEKIIDISEFIQNLAIEPLSDRDNESYTQWFLEKVKSWHNEVPQDIQEKYKTQDVIDVVENGYKNLEEKPRHGDFTPWHMINLPNGKIGLIDGEHAMKNSVEYYDIAYLIQRIFSPMDDEEYANEILRILKNRNYDFQKIKVVLASRAIGGFCDEAMIVDNPDFERAHKFKNWVLNL